MLWLPLSSWERGLGGEVRGGRTDPSRPLLRSATLPYEGRAEANSVASTLARMPALAPLSDAGRGWGRGLSPILRVILRVLRVHSG